jgi:glycogen debranching enzyme
MRTYEGNGMPIADPSADPGRAEPSPLSAPRRATAPRGIPAVAQPQPALTLVEGTSFCQSGYDGDIDPIRAEGLFVRDTRVISRWRLSIDGVGLEPLSSLATEPFHGTFVGRGAPRAGQPEATIVVERQRYVAQGMREDLAVTNYSLEPAALDLVLEVDADFADLFEVKDRRLGPREVRHESGAGELRFTLAGGARGVRITAVGAETRGRTLYFRILVPAGKTWTTTVAVMPAIDGVEIADVFPLDRPIVQTAPARRLSGWRETAPRIAVDNVVLQTALGRSERDLGALRIEDPDHPGDDVVAAGAPWFMALFGRDSLVTSYLMLPYVPALAFGTLRTLARLQGTKVDPLSEEQPGKILHEVRLGADLSLALGGSSVYYGSIDSTPLFVQLCGRALRWGADIERLRELRPAIDRALSWIVEFGDQDGDGFVEYERLSDRGLLNQGWKDSQDSMSFSSGGLARAPIALAEVQGYCYAAFEAAAQLETAWGDEIAAQSWRDRAAALKRRFHEAFWMPDLGFYAMALDRDKKPLDVVSSNIGHCLWTGIVDESVASHVVDRLIAPDMFTGFGIRTLSSDAARYNPASYHNGSVWPHDTTIAAAGMAYVGRRDAAATVTSGLLDTLEAFGGRLPELLCGFDRAERPAPVPYPASCSPQAWAAAAPYELLRLSLDLHLDIPNGTFHAAEVPDFLGSVVVDGLRAADRSLVVRADPTGATIEGLPEPLGARAG